MHKLPYHRIRPTPSTYTGRFYIVIAILALITLGLIWRLVDLTIVNRAFLKGQGDARTLRTITVHAHRGMILDRNGQPLAISTPVDSVWANPSEFVATPTDLTKLARLLNLSPKIITSKISKAEEREFVYLKRSLDPAKAEEIKNFKIPGVYLQHEYRRYYPEGEVAAHVVGFTNIDDHGQEGLELAYNEWLQGAPGIKRVLKDRLGHVVADVATLHEPKPGQNLPLSIDRRIQYFAYRELQDGVAKFKAESGSAVVLDVSTGEILAMVNSPAYNPNDRPSIHDGRYRNRAVTDLLEPGSTIKAFSMASALASGKYKFDSKVDTAPGWMIAAGKRIDDDGHNNGVIDLTTILQRSSNVGMSKIILSLPPQNLWNMLHALGFGQLTDSGFPGERSGVLANYSVWNPFVLATLSFGYGLSVTPLQLAQAYSVLAADGCKRPVTFIKVNGEPSPCQRIIEPKVAQEILLMLESVLSKGGTAPLARVPGYRVTGKTGTARIVGLHGYEKHRYNSIFMGIAPASKPRLVVAVILHDPQGRQYYGGYTSGPIFSRIMGESLRLLNVPPDDIDDASKPMTAPSAPPPGLAD